MGDDPEWKSPELDDTRWQQVDVNRGIGAQGHYAYSGFGWYRRHIDFAAEPGVKQDLTLLMPPLYGAYDVYWNSLLIGRYGRMPPHPRANFRPPPHSFGLGNGGSGVLAIRFWMPPRLFSDDGVSGGLERTPVVGSAQAVGATLGDSDHYWLQSRQFYFDLNLFYLLLAVLGFMLWLWNRERKLLFWVSLFALSQPLHVVLFNAHLPLATTLAVGADYVVSAVREISLWFLLLQLLELDRHILLRRWTLVLAWLAVAGSMLEWMVLAGMWETGHVVPYQVADGVLTILLTIVQGFPLVIVPFALRKKLPLANWMVAIAALLLEMIGVVAVMVQQGQRFTHWIRAYRILRWHVVTINGNYFDPENIATQLLLAAILFAVYRYTIDQNSRQNRFEEEFKSSQEVQRILIPEALPPLPGYSVTSAYLPAQEVGGDFFQVIALADGSALIVVGDVSGKGLKAAMSVSLIIGALRSIVEMFDDPAEILSSLNRRLQGRLQDGFATCVVVRLGVDGECVVANAGHLSPFVNCEEVELPGALPLGVAASAEFEDVRLHLDVGDRLTLYTDGLLEARSASGELYGFERVRELVATQPDAGRAADAAVAFGQDDDVTVVTVTRLAVGVESTTLLASPLLVPVR